MVIGDYKYSFRVVLLHLVLEKLKWLQGNTMISESYQDSLLNQGKSSATKLGLGLNFMFQHENVPMFPGNKLRNLSFISI